MRMSLVLRRPVVTKRLLVVRPTPVSKNHGAISSRFEVLLVESLSCLESVGLSYRWAQNNAGTFVYNQA